MQRRQNLFTRDDTFFGVCEGLGEDLRIPSNLLRAAFALGLFFNPQAVVITYFGLGALVLVSRLIFPNPRLAQTPAEAVARISAPAPAPAEPEQEELPLAA